MTIDNVVERFFAANSSLLSQKGERLINAEKILVDFIDTNRKFFLNQLDLIKVEDKTELVKKFLLSSYEKYSSQNGELPISSKNSLDADIRNWFSCSDQMVPTRESLIALAFILKFASKEQEKFDLKDEFNIEKINGLLQKFGQHKLHYGGDVPESIIYYCLLHSGHPYSHALKMNNLIEEVLNDKTIDIPVKEAPPHSKRTVAIAKDFGFSKTPDEFFDEITVSKDFFNSIQSKADKSFSKKDIDAICKILINEKFMNIKSNRTFALVHKTIQNATKKAEENNKKTKKITGTSFSLFFNEEKDTEVWYNVLSKFKAGYESLKTTPQPTRDFILLMSMLSWSIMEPQISLKDYTNEFLEKCQYQYLDEKTLPDIFIYEWNNFRIKEGKLFYLDKTVDCRDITKKTDLYYAMQIVVKHYLVYYSDKHKYRLSEPRLLNDFFQLQTSKVFFKF